MKYISILIILFGIIGCSEPTYKYDDNTNILVYGGWRTRATNIRIKMIMNHLGIKEDDFIIHRVSSGSDFNDIVHKKNQVCELCKRKSF